MFSWGQRISRADLENAAKDLDLIKLAGEQTSVPRWRYRLLPAIAYTIARCPVYVARHRAGREPVRPTINGRRVYYAQFYPTCEAALVHLREAYPGNTIGFAGGRRYTLPLVRLSLAVVLSFFSLETLRFIREVRDWRPWFSDLVLYVLVGRWARHYFRDHPRSILVFSHDHSPFEKAIARIMNEYGHDTVYVQHAAVTTQFPPLFARYSFLDGLQALRTYASVSGGTGTVVITGRQYGFAKLRSAVSDSKVALVCTSPIDEVADWRPIIDALVARGYEVLMRPHPGERRLRRWATECSDAGIRLLATSEVTLHQALASVHIVLAGTSAVLLEAAIAGRIPVLVEFARDLARGFKDHFGFVASGVAWLMRPEHALEDVDLLTQRIAGGERPREPTFFDIACGARTDTQQRALQAVVVANGMADFRAAGFVEVNDEVPRSAALPTWVPKEVIGSWQASRANDTANGLLGW